MNRSTASLVPAIVTVAAIAACHDPSTDRPTAAAGIAGAQTAANPGASPSARTPWVRARTAQGVSILEAPALVLPAPESIAAVAPPFRARVTRVAVRAGEMVKKGQVVAEVVMPEVVQAAGAYAAASTRIEAYARRKQQLESLRAEGMVKLSDLLEAETKLAEARADQQAALATLRAAELNGGDAVKLLQGNGQVALRSPIAGVVSEVHASLGETREPSAEPLARIAAEGETRIEARLVHGPPDGARFELRLPDGTRMAVKLLGRAPVVDSRDGTTPAWLAPEDARRLPAGLAGRLAVLVDDAAVAVPARAVALEDGKPHVIRNRNGVPEKVGVEVLATSGADALVRGGLAAGDEVAADASLALPLEPEGT
jgi:cobalt-zinc-cadmium efflux system membrane fusion protein